MLTLADLRARNTLPTWQEAVAITQEVLGAINARGSAGPLPDVEHIALNADGTVALLPGGTSPDKPVRHMAVILDLLLEDVSAPGPLLTIVEQNRGPYPPCGTLEEFAKELAFFERPGRAADISRLMERAEDAVEQTRADEELERLKARALAAEATPPPPLPPAPPRRLRSVAVLAVAVVLLAAAAGGYAWWARGLPWPPAVATSADASTPAPGETPEGAAERAGTDSAAPQPAPPAPVPPSAPSLVSRVGQALRSAVQSLVGSEPSSAPATAMEPAKPIRPEASRRSRPKAPGSVPALTDASASTGAPETIVESTPVQAYPETPTPSIVAAAGSDAGRIYTAADADVWPPVVARPVIPNSPPLDAPEDAVAVFDLLVDSAGVVEQVRIVSVPSQFQDRMIVAHLKAWTFEPAKKEGRPVRYRVRVRLPA